MVELRGLALHIKILLALVFLLFAGYRAEASIHGSAPLCPYGSSGGCPTPNGGTFKSTNCPALMQQTGQTWANPHPENYNVPGCDYAIGTLTPGASKPVLGSASSIPGCTWNASGWAYNSAMPYFDCVGGATISGWNVGCVGLKLDANANNQVFTLQDDYWKLLQPCANDIRKAAGTIVSNIWVPSHGLTGVTINLISNELDGNFNDSGNCCNGADGTNTNSSETWFLDADGNSGFINMYYNYFHNYGGYYLTAAGTNTNMLGGEWAYNFFEGCVLRNAYGHAECTTGNSYDGIHIHNNVGLLDRNEGGAQQAFFYLQSSDANVSGNGEIDHNRFVGNGPSLTVSPNAITATLVFATGTAGCSGSQVCVTVSATTAPIGVGMNINGTGVAFYKLISGSGGVGSVFATDCGVQGANTECPNSTTSTGVFNNGAVDVGAFTGTLTNVSVSTVAGNFNGVAYTHGSVGLINIHDNQVDATGMASNGVWGGPAGGCSSPSQFSNNNNLITNTGAYNAWSSGAGSGC